MVGQQRVGDPRGGFSQSVQDCLTGQTPTGQPRHTRRCPARCGRLQSPELEHVSPSGFEWLEGHIDPSLQSEGSQRPGLGTDVFVTGFETTFGDDVDASAELILALHREVGEGEERRS